MSTEAWPPDWRTARAEACDATCIRLGLILAELDELEQILGEEPEIVSQARQLAGRVRTVRNGYREEAESYRHATAEVT